MNSTTFKHILFAVLVFISQILLFRHLRIFGAEADFILIFLIWLISQRERTSVLIFAAVLGLSQDALLDLWGLNMFAKVSVVMFCYGMVPTAEETKPALAKIAIIILGITFLHNLILIVISAFVMSLSTTATFTTVLFANTLFTTLAGSFLYIFRNE